jgi:hypothetical protein
MPNRLSIFIIAALFVTAHAELASAQQKPNPVLKPPVLYSYWGNTKSGSISLDMALQLIDSAIWVISDKKEKMRISRFFLLYKSLDKYEDEKTGAIKQRFNTNGVQVRNDNTLTEKWRKSIYENLKKGDEILITDLYVRDNKGEYYMAPDILLTIK